MSEVTVTDYETVEKERTVTVCDVCQSNVDQAIQFVANPKVSVHERPEVIKTYEDKQQAERHIAREAKMQATMQGVGTKWGVGRVKEVEGCKGDMVLDVCSGCLETVFDVDVETRENYEWDFEGNEIGVEVTREPLFDWGKVRAVTILWILLCIVLTAANIFVL